LSRQVAWQGTAVSRPRNQGEIVLLLIAWAEPAALILPRLFCLAVRGFMRYNKSIPDFNFIF